jgi:transglutaminase-like putative cysteine protease
MSLGKVALGVASLVIGVGHLRNAGKHLSEAGRGPSAPLRGLSKAFHDSGRHNTGKGQMRMRSYHIRGLDDRIAYLRALVDEGKRDPRVYAFAREAVAKKCGPDWCTPEKDNIKEARAVYDAVRRRVRYTSDIHGVDTYQKPGHTLALGTADCDDFSTLLCSSMLSLGIPCRFKVIRTRGARDWNHIFAEAGFPRAAPTKWISMDASVPVPFGWHAPRSMVADAKVFPVR